MKALRFTITCPDCEGEVTQRAQGAPVVWQSACLVHCAPCGTEFIVRAVLERTRPKGKKS